MILILIVGNKKALSDGLPKGLIVLTITKILSFTFGNSKSGCTYTSYNTSSFYLLLNSFYFLFSPYKLISSFNTINFYNFRCTAVHLYIWFKFLHFQLGSKKNLCDLQRSYCYF